MCNIALFTIIFSFVADSSDTRSMMRSSLFYVLEGVMPFLNVRSRALLSYCAVLSASLNKTFSSFLYTAPILHFSEYNVTKILSRHEADSKGRFRHKL